jgi:hypothetical protein
MPVQFVCPQCNQLLSVGRRKIGMEVNCPRCQRSITVPTQEAAAVSVAMKQSLRSPPTEEPLAEFIVYDDVPAVVESAAPPFMPDLSTSISTSDVPRRAVRSSKAASWQWTSREEFPTAMLLLSRRGVYWQGAILAAVALIAFLVGLAIGYGVSPAPGEQNAPATPAVVQGLVQYIDPRGQTLADAGALIIAIPDESVPEPKLPAAGLRSAADGGVINVKAIEALHRAGGAYALAGGDGRYTLTAPRPGRYVVLIVSRNALRPASAGIDEFELAVMKRYFDRPEQLIARSQFNWKVEQLTSTPTDRSHTFAATEG